LADVAAEPDASAQEVAGDPVTADAEAPADAVVDKTAEAPSDADAEAPPDAAEASEDPSADAGTESAAAADPLREVTVVPGVPRYHNTQCILIRFMGDDDLEKMTLAEAKNAGCTPCRACLPDQDTD
jgi:hypothetical protein